MKESYQGASGLKTYDRFDPRSPGLGECTPSRRWRILPDDDSKPLGLTIVTRDASLFENPVDPEFLERY